MSSVISGGVGDLGRSVISLWFRIPGSTINGVTNEYNDWQDRVNEARQAGDIIPPRPRRFLGIVPLMTFGETNMKSKPFGFVDTVIGTLPPLIAHVWVTHSGPPVCDAEWVNTLVSAGGPVGGAIPAWEGDVAKVSFDIDGSYIGVDCMGKYPALSVNIVASGTPTIKGADPYDNSFEQDASWEVRGSAIDPCPGPTKYPNFCYTETYVSQTQTRTKKGYADIIAGCCPETFRLLPAGSAGNRGVSNVDGTVGGYGGIKVTPDHWHHILLSLDLTGTVTSNGRHDVTTTVGGDISTGPPGTHTSSSTIQMVTKNVASSCKMYLAFDGQNKVGKQLSVYSTVGNNISTVNGVYVRDSGTIDVHETKNEIGACGGVDVSFDSTSEHASYEFTAGKVNGSNIGLPASYSNAVRHVEMAELQVFTGVYINTGNPEALHAFIRGGKPVSPTKKATPASPFSGSIEYIASVDNEDVDIRDRSAHHLDILLHGSTKWQQGDNAGSSGKFTPIGEIKVYKPDPSLGGEQGKPQ